MQTSLAVITQDMTTGKRGKGPFAALGLSVALLGGILLSSTALADGALQPVNFMLQEPSQDPSTDLGNDLLFFNPMDRPDTFQLVQSEGSAAPSQPIGQQEGGISPVPAIGSGTNPASATPSGPVSSPTSSQVSGNPLDQGKTDIAAPSNSEVPAAPADSMPSALTSPVLDNVPTTLDKSQMSDPMAKTPKAAATKGDPPTLPAASSPAEPAKAATNTDASAATSEKREGPRLRQRFSVLYTEQRPFLLYAQDASISYLMPNALVEHPWISRILRGNLEDRALAQWQALRSKQRTVPADANGADRPELVISGRVEDRFSSSELSSLFLKETVSENDGSKQVHLFSFNFDHRSQQAFGLRDLFRSQNEDALKATINLIGAYMRADIVRQKSVRLGTPISIDQDSWLKDLNPDLALLNTFTLVPSKLSGKIAGLTFHFNPGLLGAEADGPYAVYIPAAIFAASLDEGFKAMFEGDAMLVSRHTATGFSTASVNLDGLRENAELGGDMLIEGEVPGSWCDGFHLTLVDNKTGQIVTEALIELLPSLPPYGLAGNMMRFRAELPVSGSGGQQAQLTFEPYAVETSGDRVLLRPQSACDANSVMTVPDPARDSIAIPVTY